MGFDVKDHLAIGHALDLIDFETGATVSGAKYACRIYACAILMLPCWVPFLLISCKGCISCVSKKRTGWMGPLVLGMQVRVLAASSCPTGDGFIQLCYAESGCKGICANDNS